MTQPVFPLYTTLLLPPQSMSIRSRREASTRDTANARNFELWQTDGKYGVQNRPDPNAAPVFQDFHPINSRFVERDYRGQPRFDQDGAQFGMNPYFDKYDTSYDSRNAVRELQSVVFEDKDSEGVREARSFMTRSIDNRFLNQTDLTQIAEAATQMRPLRDDIQKDYRAPANCK
uniref:Uncharacterized protein n=1 Tax=viral metagenome TaxID=1070528 RepID=A0A6C0K577_9ZZZZ